MVCDHADDSRLVQDNRRDYRARTLLHHHWGTCAVRPLIACLPHPLIPFQRIVDFMPRRCPFLVIRCPPLADGVCVPVRTLAAHSYLRLLFLHRNVHLRLRVHGSVSPCLPSSSSLPRSRMLSLLPLSPDSTPGAAFAQCSPQRSKMESLSTPQCSYLVRTLAGIVLKVVLAP